MRLDHIEHHLRGDGRIDGAAAFAQDGKSGLGGKRVRRHHHLPLCLDQRLRREAARTFRAFVGAQRCARAEGECKRQRDSKQYARIGMHHAVSIAGLALAATRLMEVAGFGDDALGAGVAARMPTRMGFLAWRERPLDVIGWRNGKRRLLLVRRRAP